MLRSGPGRLRSALQTLLWQAAAGPAVDLTARAAVFSPHFDDETLGCGGTIIKKRQVGTDVRIVFMTDGSASHKELIAGPELAKIRAREAIAACAVLGLKREHVTLLNFRDGGLRTSFDPARERVLEFLREFNPDQIFLPYSKEKPSDHAATTDIVLSALLEWRRERPTGVTVLEYPVWFWYHWPWVSLDTSTAGGYTGWAGGAISGSVDLVTQLRARVFVGDVIRVKHAALNEHRSQMMRLMPDPRWLTLHDVCNGDFLACFFRDHEVFRRYVL